MRSLRKKFSLSDSFDSFSTLFQRKEPPMRALKCLLVIGSVVVVLGNLVGCSKNSSPLSVADPVTITSSDGLLKIAAVVPANGDTLYNRVVVIGVQVIFGLKGPAVKMDSVLSTTWYFGDNADSRQSVTGAGSGEHKYTIADTGVCVVKALVTMKDKMAREVIDTFVIVTPTWNPSLTNRSVFVYLGSTKIIDGVYQVNMGQDVNKASGISPFFVGMNDWESPAYISGATPKNSAGTYYVVSKNLAAGSVYTWNGGTCWQGKTSSSTQWYGTTTLMYDKYFRSTLNGAPLSICAGFLGYNGYLYPIDSIPADSGRTSIAPVVDSTIPGVYGDAGVNGKFRFTDIKHVGGLDSIVIYANTRSLSGSVGSAIVLVTNRAIPNVGMVVLANTNWATATIAVANMPGEGLKFYVSRDSYTLSADGSKYAYVGIAPFTCWVKWIIYESGLSKRSANAFFEGIQPVK